MKISIIKKVHWGDDLIMYITAATLCGILETNISAVLQLKIIHSFNVVRVCPI